MRPRLSFALTLAGVVAGAAPLSQARAAEPERVRLEGAPAHVVAPGAGWERAGQTPGPGEFRVVFRGPKAQCEARLFAVQDVTAERTVLMHAADLVAQQVGGDGFGLTGVEARVIDGHALADAVLTVQAGAQRLEGRIRLLRATPRTWALAWGLAPSDAPPEVRGAVSAFPGSLAPSEPAFYEPPGSAEDPEQPIVPAPEGAALVRRELAAVRALIEAGLGVRFPAGSRPEVLEALVAEAREGGAKARQSFRDAARALADAAGKPAGERASLAQAVGQRIVEALFAKADSGVPYAQQLALLVSVGRKPLAGTLEDGLTRFEARALVESYGFLVALACDGPVELGPPWMSAQRDAFALRWPAFTAEERQALREAARLAPDVEVAWAAAGPSERFALRATVATRLLASPPVEPPAEPRALRTLLDARPRDPAAAGAVLATLPPGELLRLLRMLPAPGSR